MPRNTGLDRGEAYIHCAKHVPRFQRLEKRIRWGTDDPKAKSDHFFLSDEPEVSRGWEEV